jgi:peptide/nickel transport system permease protein
MISQVVKKLLSLIPLFFLISIIVFILVNMLPGSAVDSLVPEGASSELREQVARELGLDKPLHIQYAVWLRRVLRGDLGESFTWHQPVGERILERLPVSVELMSLALFLSIITGIPISIICAIKRNSSLDYAASAVSVAGIAIPNFFLGIVLILLFSYKFRILPASGYVKFSQDPIKNLQVMFLPVISISLGFTAALIRQTRSAMLEVLSQDYILTAKAKGLSGWIVLWKHALRNALIPVITVISMQIGRMIGGAAVVETVFILPGMGKHLVDGITGRDYPVVIAQVLFLALIVVGVNAIVDVVYIFIDPRISHSNNTK